MPTATVRWGQGKTHLYDWHSIRTVCGRDVPEDWTGVPGGVAYESVPNYRTHVTCASCQLGATTDALSACTT